MEKFREQEAGFRHTTCFNHLEIELILNTNSDKRLRVIFFSNLFQIKPDFSFSI